MKWNKLPDKTPPFETDLLVWFNNDWEKAYLSEIREGKTGKIFEFTYLDVDHIDSKITNATHWTIPTKPKE